MTGRFEGRREQDSSLAIALRGLGELSWSVLASLLAGLGALAFLTTGRVVVGLGEFAPLAHVWTVWSIGAATVGFGAQIETIERLAQGRGLFSIRHIRLGVTGVGVAGVLTFVWRNSLFGSEALFWPMVCAVIPVGSLVTGTARGALASYDQHRRLAVVIAGENAVRFCLALMLWWLGAQSEHLAIVLLAGFAVAAVGLSSFRVDRATHRGDQVSTGAAGAVAGLTAHLSLVLPPVVLSLQGARPEVVAAVFLVLTYLRAPYQFLLGLGPALTAQSFTLRPSLMSAWFSNGRRTGVVAGFLIVAAFGFGLVAGDLMSTVIVGRTDIIQPLDYAILCALVVGVAFAILRTLYVLPRGGAKLVFQAWVSAAIIGISFAFVQSGPRVLFVGLLLGIALCLVQLSLNETYAKPVKKAR